MVNKPVTLGGSDGGGSLNLCVCTLSTIFGYFVFVLFKDYKTKLHTQSTTIAAI